MSYILKKHNNSKIVKIAIYISGFISICYGLMQILHFDVFNRLENIDRISGFHKNPYSYGGQLIVFFFIFLTSLVFYNGKNNLQRAIKFLFLIISFICVLNTNERAIVLGLFVGVVSFFILKEKFYKDIFSSKLKFLVFIPIVLIVILNKKFLVRIRKTIFPPKGVESLIRLKLWGLALSLWKQNILFGLGKFPVVRYQPGDLSSVQYLTHAHNVYLQVLVTNGLCGLFAFLNLIFFVFKYLFKNIKTNQYVICLIAVLIALLTEGFFEYFWGDSEVRYCLLYFCGFVFGTLMEVNTKKV